MTEWSVDINANRLRTCPQINGLKEIQTFSHQHSVPIPHKQKETKHSMSRQIKKRTPQNGFFLKGAGEQVKVSTSLHTKYPSDDLRLQQKQLDRKRGKTEFTKVVHTHVPWETE